MSKPRIGIIDIETAPIKAFTFSTFKTNIGVEQIVEEWSILSFALKDLGAPKRAVTYMDTSGDPKDDLFICGELHRALHDYDLLIAHNGRRFDLKKIKARLLLHGFPPPRPVKIIDTLEMAKRAGAFTSNKLAWLSKYMARSEKLAHGAFAGFTLWKECLDDNPKAWAEMKKYNIRDIVSLEDVYLKLRPWASDSHPNVAVYDDDDSLLCPICGGKHLTQDGHYFTNVGKYDQYQCGTCGAWSRSRYTLNSAAKRRSLLNAI